MNRRTVLVISILFLIIATWVGVRLASQEDAWLCDSGQWVRHGNPDTPQPTSGCATPLSNYWVCRDGAWQKFGNPNTPQPSTQCAVATSSLSANIEVTYPAAGAVLGEQFVVTGQARVFENQFMLRLTRLAGGATEKDAVLFSQPISASAAGPGNFGEFSYAVSMTELPGAISGNYLLEAYDNSPKDGSEIYKVGVPFKYISKSEPVMVSNQLLGFSFTLPSGYETTSTSSTNISYFNGPSPLDITAYPAASTSIEALLQLEIDNLTHKASSTYKVKKIKLAGRDAFLGEGIFKGSMYGAILMFELPQAVKDNGQDLKIVEVTMQQAVQDQIINSWKFIK